MIKVKEIFQNSRSLSHIYLAVFAILLMAYYVVVIAQPLAFHLHGATVIDDTFYYLTYAQNIAAGLGSTYGGMLTNGVQPLWAGILVIPALVVKDHETYLRLALVIAAFLNVASAP